MPLAPSSTINKSASTISAPISVAPSISKAPISTLPAVVMVFSFVSAILPANFAFVTALSFIFAVVTFASVIFAVVTASSANFAVVTLESAICAVSIEPSTKCSLFMLSSAILVPSTASAPILPVVIAPFAIVTAPDALAVKSLDNPE